MGIFRGFIAIDLNVTEQIAKFRQDIVHAAADLKLVESDNIHLTIKFLGDTNEQHIEGIERYIQESVRDIKPFSVALKGVGVFPNHQYIKVIWIGLHDDGFLETIAKSLNQKLTSLGFPKDNKVFSPHLTIARLKSERNKNKILEVLKRYEDKNFASHIVQSILLKKSQLTPTGPIYHTLREVFL